MPYRSTTSRSTGRTRRAGATAPAPATTSTARRWTPRSGTRSCGPSRRRSPFADGDLKVTTVLGDIYTNGDPSGTRNFLLQSADHIGKEDYVLETKVDVSQLNGGYAQGGILVRTDDDNYIKFDAISDVDNPKFNRIELRSEQAGAILNPQPQVTTGFPAVVNDVWLRLTKTGTTYKGEYSLDGSTWTALSATVTNTQTNADFGLFTLGVQIADRVVGFEYFKVDGSTGCPPTEEENNAPVISEISATPSTGFAPAAGQVRDDGDRRGRRRPDLQLGLR